MVFDLLGQQARRPCALHRGPRTGSAGHRAKRRHARPLLRAGKLLSPLEGVGPEDLPLETLKRRLARDEIREIVVATPPSVDGEATALLLARELQRRELAHLAHRERGTHGGDLEFADQITLGRAIEGRKDL